MNRKKQSTNQNLQAPFNEFRFPMNLNESSTAGMSSSESKTPEPESKAPENQTSVEPSDPSSESKTLESESKASENLTATEPSNPSSEDEKLGEQTQEEGEEEEEEEGECGFCLFMKGGGCKESFIAWEKCIEDGETNKEDIVEKCFEVTAALKKCMESHSDYYEPVLRAEKAAEEELEREVASRDSEKSKEDGNSEEAVSEEN